MEAAGCSNNKTAHADELNSSAWILTKKKKKEFIRVDPFNFFKFWDGKHQDIIVSLI